MDLISFYTNIQSHYKAKYEGLTSETLQNSKTSFFCQNYQLLQNSSHFIFGSCIFCFNTSNTFHISYQSYPSPCPGSVSSISAIAIFKFGGCSLTSTESFGHPQSKLGIGIAWRNSKEAHTILRPHSKSPHCHIQIQLKEVFFSNSISVFRHPQAMICEAKM